MNPFATGVVAAHGLHAVMSRSIAAKAERTVQERLYPFFYNPMWSHFGDMAEPPGAYYYEHAEQVVYFWNMFDQVLLRPALLPVFDNRSLRILTTDGEGSFLTERGLPNKSTHSDHLPILFELSI